MSKARLILHPPQNAFLNMALDEALFISAPQLPWPATLRLYGWYPAAISLGRRQKPHEVNMEACRQNGIDVVKRVGGGSAVYHKDEITYCFVCRLDALPAPDAKTWRQLFALFMEKLGAQPDGGRSCTTSRHTNSACFSCAAEDEPTIGGKKFVGSARRKSKTVFLQHGSILLRSQPQILQTLVANAEADASVGLMDVIPSLSREDAQKVFAETVAEILGLQFEPGAFTGAEKAAASAIELLKRRETDTA